MPEARRRTARSSKNSSNTEVKITKHSQASYNDENHSEASRIQNKQEVSTSISNNNDESHSHHQPNEQVTYFNKDTKQLLNIPSQPDEYQHENSDEMMNQHEHEEYDDSVHENYESDAEGEEYEEEYDELDLTEDRLYDVLSPFLETQDGEGVADVLLGIRESLDEHTEAIRELNQTLRDYFNRRTVSASVNRSSKSGSRQ